MEDLNVLNNINNTGGWLVHNQSLLLSYMVNIIAAIAIIIIGMFVARVIVKGINHLLQVRHIDATIADFLLVLVRYSIITFALIAALGCVGIQTASVIAVLGAAGLAVGLALQGSLSNLAAGVLLVIFRPFRVGEFIDLGGIKGIVMHIQIFSTTLRTNDGKIIIIPNGKIIAGNIINYSREPVRRNEFIIGVSYNADINQVISLLHKVICNDPRVLQDRGIQIGLNELAASSINFVVRCWSKIGDLQNVYWDLMKNFKITLDAHGIGIPYPQIDVHLHHVKLANEEKINTDNNGI